MNQQLASNRPLVPDSTFKTFLVRRIERIHISYLRLNPWAVGGALDRFVDSFLTRSTEPRTSAWPEQFAASGIVQRLH